MRARLGGQVSQLGTANLVVFVYYLLFPYRGVSRGSRFHQGVHFEQCVAKRSRRRLLLAVVDVASSLECQEEPVGHKQDRSGQNQNGRDLQGSLSSTERSLGFVIRYRGSDM